VLATSGDTALGGEDFDSRIVDLMIAHFERDTDYQKTVR
jgi:molecular chaperone DnaK (HSP70)